MTAGELAFIGGSFDRVARRRTDRAWLEAALSAAGTRFVQFRGDRPMIDVGGAEPSVALVGAAQLEPSLDHTEPVLLGLDERGDPLFAVQSRLGVDEPLPDAVKLIDLRSLAAQGVLDAGVLGTLAQARSLLHWHAHHRFCPNCGAQTEPAEAGSKRVCATCRAQHFPRTDPVAIMVVVDRDRVLLGRGPHFAPGTYSALAGFIEPGETIEDGARREIAEESGVTVGKVTYVASQPWPFPSSLMIGLIGEALTTELDVDRSELEDCRWFHRDEVRLMLQGEHPQGLGTPRPMAIAHHLIAGVV